jgi:hypothetical protein
MGLGRPDPEILFPRSDGRTIYQQGWCAAGFATVSEEEAKREVACHSFRLPGESVTIEGGHKGVRQ